jgi:hypothetical protein
MFPATLPFASLRFKKVVKLGLCIQIFLEAEDPLLFDNVSYFTVGVEKVSKFSCPRGTSFYTGGVSSHSHTLNTKGALFHNILHPRSVPKVVDGRIPLFDRDVWLCPIKDSPLIRACRNAVPATNAPVVIDHYQPIRFFPGRMDRTYFHTRRVLTMLALDRHIDEPFLRYCLRGVVVFRFFEIDQIPFLESYDSDPLKLRFRTRGIVFFHTGIDASPTPNAPGKVKAIAPEGFGKGFLRAHLKFLLIFSKVFFFQSDDEKFLFFLRHLKKMFLQEVFGFLLRARRKEG